jgi:hypothetical protein
MQMTIGAPGEEAAPVGLGMLAGRSGVPGQIGGDSSVELVSGGPGGGGEWGYFVLDHDPTVRPPMLAAQCRVILGPPRAPACGRGKDAGQD